MATTTESSEISEWHEQCMEWLLRRSGLTVVREPHIKGKTPDLLVTQPSGQDVIIECLAKLEDPTHAEEKRRGPHTCGGDIKDLHGLLYSRVKEKAAKYKHLDGPYVIAVYDDSCMNFINTAMNIAFSAYAPYVELNSMGEFVNNGYSDQWSTPERSASLFRLYPNLSGLKYSHWKRKHYFIPRKLRNSRASPERGEK